MNPAQRFLFELSTLRRTVNADVYASYWLALARAMPSIVAEKNLAPADRLMGGTVQIHYGTRSFLIPAGPMDATLSNDTPTFAGIREMYARNVYLRLAPKDLRTTTVVDVGANRGMFALLAATALQAEVVVLIEVLEKYRESWRLWRQANQLKDSRFHDYFARCDSVDSPESVSLNRVFEKLPGGTCDLLKMDIEGGELAVFSKNLEWLERTRCMTAEMHPLEVDTSPVYARLREAGFATIATDALGNPTWESEATYVFAIRK